MVINTQTVLRCMGPMCVGAAVSTGYPAGIAAGITMPAFAMRQPTRLNAYGSAICYYAGATWPVVPAVRNFFGPSASVFDGIIAWLAAAALLATPWLLVWTKNTGQVLWRVPLALFATVVPPLGLIGWASPLTAAGFVFPGTAWFGLLAVALLCAGMCIRPSVTHTAIVAVVLGALAHLKYPGDPPPPASWEAVDTSFGAIAHGPADPIREYTAARWIQDKARCSHAHVIIFPEMVVPRWTTATDLFWQPTLARLSASGKTILIGAGLPGSFRHPNSSTAALDSYDFGAAIAALRGAQVCIQANGENSSVSDFYRNVIVIRGNQAGTFVQRVPVPFGMWHPFSGGGVPLNFFGPGVIRIENQRAAILICYEQLLTWPVLVSMVEHPTVIVAVANDYWVERTLIPRYKATAARGWGRLFGIPVISAVNR
jgi:predicted amidohydrolase